MASSSELAPWLHYTKAVGVGSWGLRVLKGFCEGLFEGLKKCSKREVRANLGM